MNFINKEIRKYPELDTIRFIAVTLVVLHHLFFQSNMLFEWTSEHAWIGVDIFFTLSGFLITTLLFKEWKKSGTISIKQFWIKRMLRLWPSWLLAILVSSLLVFYIGQRAPEIEKSLFEKLWHYLFHFSNYSHAYFGKLHTLFSHFWSLSVEEHFYLVWPLLFLFALRTKNAIPYVLSLSVFLPYVFRVMHKLGGWEQITITFSTHTRFDALAWGCLLAIFFDRLKRLNGKQEIGLTILFFIIISLSPIVSKSQTLSPFISQLGFTMTSIATCILIWIAMKGTQKGMRRVLQIRIFSYLGILSYGVYLFHFHTNFIIFYSLNYFSLELGEISIALLSLTFSYLPAAFTYYMIDKKMHHIKKRFIKE